MDHTKEALEYTLGFPVTNYALYEQAFVHKSCASNELQSYDRLEFLGDAVINLVIARWLWELFPREQEGFLTKLRTRLVSGKCLSRLSARLELHRFIRMNDRALSAGYNKNPRIAEDVFEALIGAIYISEGLVVAREFLIRLYRTCINFTQLMTTNDNFKDCLMRWSQAKGHALPVYDVVAVHPGRSSDQKATFEVSVSMQGVPGISGKGRGHTKKMAQQEAAKHALALLGVPETY